MTDSTPSRITNSPKGPNTGKGGEAKREKAAPASAKGDETAQPKRQINVRAGTQPKAIRNAEALEAMPQQAQLIELNGQLQKLPQNHNHARELSRQMLGIMTEMLTSGYASDEED